MAIVRVDPADIALANVVQVDSDAPDHIKAIVEMEQWAGEHDFARIPGYWLREIFANGRRVFRGICYRLTEEETNSSRTVSEMIQQTAEQLPITIRDADEVAGPS